MSAPHSSRGKRQPEHCNPELVAKLEAERARIRQPFWAPASPEAIRELVDAIVNTDRDGQPRRRPRNIPLRAVS